MSRLDFLQSRAKRHGLEVLEDFLVLLVEPLADLLRGAPLGISPPGLGAAALLDLRIVSSALAGKSNAMSDRGRGCLLPGAEAAAHREAALCRAVSRLG